VSGWLALSAVVVLIGLNGLFVAAEFAVVSARGPALDDLAASGDRRAREVNDLLGRLPFFLSMVQFGITVTSLIVGFLADRALGATIVRPVLAMLGIPAEASVAISVSLALLLSTFVQMLLGELFPKNVAISRPIAVARSLSGFSRHRDRRAGPGRPRPRPRRRRSPGRCSASRRPRTSMMRPDSMSSAGSSPHPGHGEA
jgi:CBS domain containing-hemolysin-like protein